jgi:retron-type reverse transcriptase
MKRHGQLMAQIADADNLRLAFWKAAKGKRGKADCLAFRERLEENLVALGEELLAGSVSVGDYHYFKVHDPKERLICAATFRERVLHHALMNVCEPVLERAAVFDSYACRKGKGRLRAVDRAEAYARRHRWFLKMDIRQYFASIHQATLGALLGRKFKDPVLLGVFDRIIGSYHSTPGRGLPIGNLTSQHFANYYLSPLDRFVKERLQRGAYVRYMDDFVVWGESGRELRAVCERVRAFLAAELKLELKDNTGINRTAFGMDFLGYRVFPGTVRLARRSKVRFARKFQRYEAAHLRGEWSELVLQQRVQALLAFVMPAESGAFRRHVLQRFGVAAKGLEPRESGRQLEQQRDQLPGGEPQQQQQQPDEQQQQHRVPVRPAPSSIGAPDGVPADPAAIPSRGPARLRANTETPPGASRPEGLWAKAPGGLHVWEN